MPFNHLIEESQDRESNPVFEVIVYQHWDSADTQEVACKDFYSMESAQAWIDENYPESEKV